MTLVQCFYLEYFCAFLTSLSFWFLPFRAMQASYAEARKTGGEFLYRTRKPLEKQWVFFGFLLTGFMNIMIPVFSLTLGVPFSSMNMVNLVLGFGFPFAHYPWTRIDFEIRKQGILTMRKKLKHKILIPWQKINFGEWVPSRRVLTLHYDDSTVAYPLHAADAKKSLEILGRFIEIRNEQGEVIFAGKPEPMSNEEAAALEKYQNRNPYQFSILSMLLLMVVVASGAGWYAVAQEYNRLQQNALNALNRFSPNRYNGPCSAVSFLDFSAKYLPATPTTPLPPKITDADIALIKPFHLLKTLNLSESDITDAAIPDLITLQSLEYLSIGKTKITPEGAERLRNEMPNTVIAH